MEPWVLVFIGLLGAIFLAAGTIGHRIHKKRTERCTVRTHGEVADVVIEEETEPRRRMSYAPSKFHFPVFAYQVDGVRFMKKSKIGTYPPRFAKGRIVTVCYNPDNPSEFIVEDDTAPARFCFWFTVIGIVILLFVLCLAVFIPS